MDAAIACGAPVSPANVDVACTRPRFILTDVDFDWSVSAEPWPRTFVEVAVEVLS